MSRNILNYTVSFVVLLLVFAKVQCVDKESLRAYQPIYGLASVIEETLSNSSVCFKELKEFRDAVDSKKVWGLKMLDASGKPRSGFLYGNNLWIGSHTQCTDIPNQKKYEIRNDKVNHTETPFDYPPYAVGFSMVLLRHNSTLQQKMRLPLDWIVQLGLCVPKSCSEQELYNLSSKYFSGYPLEFQQEYEVNLEVTRIRVLEDGLLWLLKLPKTIIFLVVTTVILMLTVIGTILDVKEHNRTKNIIRGHNNGVVNGKDFKGIGFLGGSVELVNSTTDISSETKRDNLCVTMLKNFSFYSNVKRWAKTKISEESLASIHGLRFLAMGWVIVVHTSFFQRDFAENPPYAWRLTETLPSQIISNSTFCVDTFLFLSGFLLAYLYFKRGQANDNMNQPVTFVGKFTTFLFLNFNRFLRLTPAYAYILLLCDVGYTFYSKNSAFFYVDQPEVLCDKYWWRNLLYINNLFPRSEMCLSWSWYLSADTQFFVITSFLLILSTEFFSFSAFLMILMMILQIIVTTYKSYSIGYLPTMDDQLEHLDSLYDLPWNRIGPYLVGVITAYIFIFKMNNKLVLKKRTRVILWILFPLLNLWILFGLYTRDFSAEFAAFYMGTSRTLWAVGIAWIVIATSTGNARLLEKFLCYKGWIPLSRLTYCAYLLNPLVVTITSLGSEQPTVVSIAGGAISAYGTWMTTFIVAFLICTLLESPFILLSKMLIKSVTRPSNKSVSQETISQVNHNGTAGNNGNGNIA